MSKYLDVISDTTAGIRGISYSLTKLSNAFWATGNRELGEKLSYMADALMAEQKSINDAVGIELRDRCQASHQAAMNTVKSCLAMSALAKEEHQDGN